MLDQLTATDYWRTKNTEKEISTSFWSAQRPKAGQNIQQITDLPALHDHDLVVGGDCVNPVSDREDGARLESLTNRRLYQEVGLEVNRGRGLVQQQNFVAPEIKSNSISRI